MRKVVFTIVVFTIVTSRLFAQQVIWETVEPLPGIQRLLDCTPSGDDSTLIAIGSNFTNPFNGEILKFKNNGQLLWRRDINLPGFQEFVAQQILPYSNFQYVLTGNGTTTGNADVQVIAIIDSAGNQIRRNTYAYPSFDVAIKSIVLRDKSIITIANRTIVDDEINVRREDSLGGLIFDSSYSMIGNQSIYDITEMLDGSLIIGGSSDGDNLIMRIGFDGRLIDTKVSQSILGDIDHFFVELLPYNELMLMNDAWDGNWYVGQNIIYDSELNLIQNNSHYNWIRSEFSVLYDSSIVYSRSPDIDSVLLSKKEVVSGIQSDLLLSIQEPRSSPLFQIHSGNSLFLGGASTQSSQTNYWIAKIDSVGEAWIPDHCAFSPPEAAFTYEYNYPVLTLIDTSYAGLIYLDSIYSWKWNTSIGQGGNTDTIDIFYDSAISNTIDVELIISNWYGCRDTVNKTLTFEPNGVSEYRDLEVKIYPNPVSEFLNIEFSETPDKAVLFELYDIQGVKHIQLKSKERVLRTRISGLPRGLYFYRISAGSQVIPLNKGRGKIVKQ